VCSSDLLDARGVDTSKLLVSANAHIIPSYNRTLDKVTERFLGSRKIGTTGRGIGPTYADKMSRVGIRVQDIFDEKILRQKVEGALAQKNHLLVKVYNRRAIEVDEVVAELLAHAERLRPMVADTSLVLGDALAREEVVLAGSGATGAVWYPPSGFQSPRGLLIGAYVSGPPAAAFEALPLSEQIARARASVERLHPGHGALRNAQVL